MNSRLYSLYNVKQHSILYKKRTFLTFILSKQGSFVCLLPPPILARLLCDQSFVCLYQGLYIVLYNYLFVSKINQKSFNGFSLKFRNIKNILKWRTRLILKKIGQVLCNLSIFNGFMCFLWVRLAYTWRHKEVTRSQRKNVWLNLYLYLWKRVCLSDHYTNQHKTLWNYNDTSF